MAQFYQIQKKDLSKDHAEITIPKRGKIAALFKVKMNTLFKHKNYTLFCGTYPAYTWEYPPPLGPHSTLAGLFSGAKQH